MNFITWYRLPEEKVAPLLRLVRDQLDEQQAVRDLPFIGMLDAEPDFAQRAEEILRAEDNHPSDMRTCL
ncbi:hypothetical protein ACFYUV_47690 [Nonomuraea sp. NPDC003560]|uniref:hypothetical protein n=1 Tax=Nonomuraea sp. NPDC003560 TaxID=3364341 RepID=UPI0036B68727